MIAKLNGAYQSARIGHLMPCIAAMTTVSSLMLIVQVPVNEQEIEMRKDKHTSACFRKGFSYSGIQLFGDFISRSHSILEDDEAFKDYTKNLRWNRVDDRDILRKCFMTRGYINCS